LEELTYDGSGQPTSASLMDYLLPTAGDMPEVGFLICEDAPTPTNPLGAKGAGESGIMPVGAVVAAAVEDALGAPGVVTQLPLHPDRVQAWAAQAAARR
jgi:aerobic carbon-monoxide dehydrogenase large subunit